MNLFSMWMVRLSLAALLAPSYGLQGVWFAMACELAFRGLIFIGECGGKYKVYNNISIFC